MCFFSGLTFFAQSPIVLCSSRMCAAQFNLEIYLLLSRVHICKPVKKMNIIMNFISKMFAAYICASRNCKFLYYCILVSLCKRTVVGEYVAFVRFGTMVVPWMRCNKNPNLYLYNHVFFLCTIAGAAAYVCSHRGL